MVVLRYCNGWTLCSLFYCGRAVGIYLIEGRDCFRVESGIGSSKTRLMSLTPGRSSVMYWRIQANTAGTVRHTLAAHSISSLHMCSRVSSRHVTDAPVYILLGPINCAMATLTFDSSGHFRSATYRWAARFSSFPLTWNERLELPKPSSTASERPPLSPASLLRRQAPERVLAEYFGAFLNASSRDAMTVAARPPSATADPRGPRAAWAEPPVGLAAASATKAPMARAPRRNVSSSWSTAAKCLAVRTAGDAAAPPNPSYRWSLIAECANPGDHRPWASFRQARACARGSRRSARVRWRRFPAMWAAGALA